MGQSRIDREVWTGFVESNSVIDNIIDFIQFNRDNPEASEGRKDDSKRVYDYFHGVRQKDLLEDELIKRFPTTYSLRRKAVENVTSAIVNQISVVYKSPPTRIVSIPQTQADGGTDLDQSEEIQSIYDSMVKQVQHDKVMQKLERYQTFDRTNLVQIGWKDKANKLTEIVLPQFLFDVMLDDEGELKAVIKSDFFGDEDNEEFRVYEVWTDENFWKLDNDLNIINQPDNEDNLNPYGELPFYLARSFEPDQGVYCDADNTLADINLNVNLLLTDLMYQSELQSHGQPVANNVKFSSDVKFGPETVLEIEPANPEAGPASFNFLQTNADFDGIFKTLDRVLTGYTTSRGLPEGMFSFEKSGSAESGISLKIQNAPLIEFRQSGEETYRRHEEKILRKQIMVWNFNVENHQMGLLPEDLAINITYKNASEAFETPKDKISTMMTLLAMGLMKPTEIVMENHPSFTPEDAEKYLEEVLAEKSRFINGTGGTPAQRASSTFNQIFSNGTESNQG